MGLIERIIDIVFYKYADSINEVSLMAQYVVGHISLVFVESCGVNIGSGRHTITGN